MTALECRKILDKVQKQLSTISYNSDLHKFYKNLEKMVDTISRKEVECRRKKQYNDLITPLQNFKDEVDRLEKLILIAKLVE